ncbi:MULTISPECIES: hypothetical protein [unclassified Streptomyces]|uniref:hypothetical protein n=1 Tax=unclassified Streptomyces TaxID=2593676 RepID=UPI0033A39DEE
MPAPSASVQDIEGSGRAFMNGLHTAVLVTGALCVVGAALAAVGVRSTQSSRARTGGTS